MRDRFDVSLARQIGDPAGDGEAAAAREIGLEDVDVAALDERPVGRSPESASPAAILTDTASDIRR